MKVIFTEDVRGRGKRGQVKEVPDGYAQNFLFKKNLAKPANSGNLNTLARIQANEKAAYEAEKADAEKVKAQLEDDKTVVKFTSKAGADSRLFGSISSKKIVEELEKQFKIKVDKRKLELSEPVKTLGYTNVKVKLFKGVEATIRIHVVPEG
ncbi:MAG: 50S ribosomal protein L9 [Lactobacillus sp.]|nr:50S ribosomal protein L9 [Lactobacillus sp.]